MQWAITAVREINIHSQIHSQSGILLGGKQEGAGIQTWLSWQIQESKFYCGNTSCRRILTLEGVIGNLKFLVHWMHRVAALQKHQSKPQGFNLYLHTISLRHSCSHPFLNQVWHAWNRRLPQRGDSWGRAVPICVGRGDHITCSWRWKNYTGKKTSSDLPIVSP